MTIRTKKTNLAAGLFLFALPVFLWAGSPSKTILVYNLKPKEAHVVVSASERLVWNRDSGLAVAEIPDAEYARVLPLIKDGRAELKKDEDFQKALAIYLPEYSDKKASGGGYSGNFAVKKPATLVKPAKAVKALRDTGLRNRVEDGNCLSEDFEDSNLPIWYENGGDWWHYSDSHQNDKGDYFWSDQDCDAYSGSWSADSILGGDIGGSLQCGATYDYDTDSWMEYAPWITCVSNSAEGYLDFYTTLETETDYDPFYYLVTVDDSNYQGYSLSGNWSDAWYWIDQDLRHWYNLGDLSTYPHFGLAFVFQSDDVVNDGFGVRVDRITISTTAMAATATADPSWGKIPLQVQFTASVQGGTPPYSYRWDFGDQSPVSYEQNPVHTYTVAGSYQVRLSVDDSLEQSAAGGVTVQADEPVIPVVDLMKKKRRPFRIVVKGNSLEKGIRVFIEGVEWTKVWWKSNFKIILKGKNALKQAVPKGVPTHFLFENPDGSVTTYTFTR